MLGAPHNSLDSHPRIELPLIGITHEMPRFPKPDIQMRKKHTDSSQNSKQYEIEYLFLTALGGTGTHRRRPANRLADVHSYRSEKWFLTPPDTLFSEAVAAE